MPLLVCAFKVTMTLWFIRREFNIRLLGCLVVALPRTFLSPLLPDYIPVTCSKGCFCFLTDCATTAQLSRFGLLNWKCEWWLAVCPSFRNWLEELLSLFDSHPASRPALAFHTTSLSASMPFSLFLSPSFPLPLSQSLSAASAVLFW